MVAQLENTDNAKEVLDISNLNNTDANFNSNIELLRSQFLFEAALRKLNMHVTLYHKGSILTEEKYLSSVFNVQPYELKDSALVNTPIYVKFDEQGENYTLSYEFQGIKIEEKAKVGEHLVNNHFDLVLKLTSSTGLKEVQTEDELFFEFNSISSLSEKFLKNLNVQPLDVGARTVQLTFEGYQPDFCRDILNSVIQTFFEFDLQLKKKGSENVLAFIDQQLDSLSNELKSSKNDLMDFTRNSKGGAMDDNFNLAEEMEALQIEMIEVTEEKRTLESVMERVNNNPQRLDIYRLLPEMLGKSYENSLSQLVSELQQLLEEKEDLSFEVTPENHIYKALEKRIASKIELIRKTEEIIQNKLNKRMENLRVKIRDFEKMMYDFPEQRMEYGRLKGIQDLNEKFFSLLTEKKVIYAISDAGFSSKNRILSRAESISTPIKPDKNGLYSAFVGLGVAFGLFFLAIKYVRFNEINYIDDLKSILPDQVSFVGTIPLLKDAMAFSELIVHDKPKSVITESFRTVRTNFSFINSDYKTVAISDLYCFEYCGCNSNVR